jgi:hypothetical protein
VKTTITFLFLVIEKCFPTVFWLKFGPSKVRSIFLNAGPPRKILQGGTRLLWARSLSESYIIGVKMFLAHYYNISSKD